MLALTRRVGEEIVIGDPRKPLGVIRVVEVHGDKVRLSFDFPKDVPVNRRELAELKAKQAAEQEQTGVSANPGAPAASPAPAATPAPPPSRT